MKPTRSNSGTDNYRATWKEHVGRMPEQMKPHQRKIDKPNGRRSLEDPVRDGYNKYTKILSGRNRQFCPNLGS